MKKQYGSKKKKRYNEFLERKEKKRQKELRRQRLKNSNSIEDFAREFGINLK